MLQDIRRQYRELFYTADIGHHISGAIMFKETLAQASSDGIPFVKCLERQGVLPGIKVDQVSTDVKPNNAACMPAGPNLLHCFFCAGSDAVWRQR